MSTIVQEISTALETTIESVVTDLVKLDFIIDAQKQFDNSRSLTNRYGVWPQGIVNTENITKAYVVDHEYRVQLLREYANRDGTDSNQRTTTYDLYDDLDTIIKELHLGRAGCPGLILNIEFASASPVQFIDESDIVLLDAFFTVKYTRNMTWV